MLRVGNDIETRPRWSKMRPLATLSFIYYFSTILIAPFSTSLLPPCSSFLIAAFSPSLLPTFHFIQKRLFLKFDESGPRDGRTYRTTDGRGRLKRCAGVYKNKAQQANNVSMGISSTWSKWSTLSTFSTLSTPSAPSTFSNVKVRPHRWFL